MNNDIKDNIALICPDDAESGDLIHVASNVIENKIGIISVSPRDVGELWTWLEKASVQIMARFIFDGDMSNISRQIKKSFSNGSYGAQIFIPTNLLSEFFAEFMRIRDDLFFNRTLSIGLDINEINISDWDRVFEILSQMRADAIILTGAVDKNFVGRIVAMLENWNFPGALHLAIGDDMAAEQVMRLSQKMRPELVKGLRVFVG